MEPALRFRRTIVLMRAALLLLCSLLTACGTIRTGSHQAIQVDSDPAGALIAVDCGEAERHPGLRTPAVLHLPRAAEHCAILLTKPGYQHASFELNRALSPASVANMELAVVGSELLAEDCCGPDWFFVTGAFIAGGAVLGAAGMAIDGATGALWEHQPASIFLVLEEEAEQGSD